MGAASGVRLDRRGQRRDAQRTGNHQGWRKNEMSKRLLHAAVSTGVLLAGVLLVAPGPVWADGAADAGSACTIVGTAGDDVLRGTPGPDVICGFGGDDVLIGYEGDDVLLGGPGNDVLLGGSGSDRLHGEGDDDRLVDTTGPSTENGGDGTDLCVAVIGSPVTTGCERVFTVPGRKP